MKVLYITNCPAPYRVNFFNELTKYCDLTVLFETDKARNREEKWKSSEEHKFHTFFLKSWFEGQESAFCPDVVKYIKKFKNDIIVVGGYSTPTGMWSIVYMKTHHISYVLNCDGGMIKDDSKLKYRIKKYFIGSASAWLSTGTGCNQYLVHYGAEKDRIYLYPFTSIKQADIGRIDPKQRVAMRETLKIQENKVILFVGSFIYRKGLDILLDACSDMKDVALVLVGGNDVKEFWPRQKADLKCHVYVEGFKSEMEVKKYYQMADVFVLPTREDVWGLVINEAMAAGLPVITTDQCGAGVELIEDGVNGYIVPSNDGELLRQSIVKLLNNKNLQEEMCSCNLKKIQKYTIEKMAELHNKIFIDFKEEIL